MPTFADITTKINVWPPADRLHAINQTLRQQGGTREDGHVHLADWTLSVAAIEKKIIMHYLEQCYRSAICTVRC